MNHIINYILYALSVWRYKSENNFALGKPA